MPSLSLHRSLIGVPFVALLIGFIALVIWPTDAHSLATKPAAVTDALLTQPNIIYILTDDQRWDSLCPSPDDMGGLCASAESAPMPAMMALKAQSIVFPNAFFSYPLCCPSRASFLLGGLYAQHTHVRGNEVPVGGAIVMAQRDDASMGTWLQEAGYQTALVGKYLNQYHMLVDVEAQDAYVPPGWNWWTVLAHQGDRLANFDVVSAVNDLPPIIEHVTDRFMLDWEREQSEAFIQSVCPTDVPAECTAPFFLFYNTTSPHEPALTPPGQYYDDLYTDFAYAGRGYLEANLSDKPEHLRWQASLFSDLLTQQEIRSQLRSLRWLDDNLAQLLIFLEQKRLRQNTVIIFASDNGYMWGEHKLVRKSVPFEESIRGPLFLFHPSLAPRQINSMVAIDLDVAPTILELARASASVPTDGISLKGLIDGTVAPRTQLLIQGSFDMELEEFPQAWAGLRTADGKKYVRYITGEEQFYDLRNDPFELQSRPVTPELRAALDDALRVVNQGVTISTENLPRPTRNGLPPGQAGAPYTFQFAAQWGIPPYTWQAYIPESGRECISAWPDGLALDPATGTLAGTPALAGTFELCVKVMDSSSAKEPGRDYRKFSLTLN